MTASATSTRRLMLQPSPRPRRGSCPSSRDPSMLSWMDDDLNERRRRGLYRTRRHLQPAQGVRGVLRGGEYLNSSPNDSLALAADPRLARAAARAARRYGTGAGASPLVSGLTPPLRRLERLLAEWERTEAAVVFSSGFAANLA